MFDLEMIRAVYERFPGRVAAARQATGKALTLAEKILYTHLWDGEAKTAFTRGADYVDFAPDRVACLLYTSPSPRDMRRARMPSSA